MENFKDIIDVVENVLPTVSFCIAFFTFVFYLVDRRIQKLNIDFLWRQEILGWVKQCHHVIFNLRKKGLSAEEKNSLMCELSKLIDDGRFYFPNIVTKEDREEEPDKPAAYQGKRSQIVGDLFDIYEFYLKEKDEKKAVDLQRIFTSDIVSALKPDRFIKKINKIANANMEKPKAEKR